MTTKENVLFLFKTVVGNNSVTLKMPLNLSF